jgi:hypothetical protein
MRKYLQGDWSQIDSCQTNQQKRTTRFQTPPDPIIAPSALLATTVATLRTWFQILPNRTNGAVVHSNVTDTGYYIRSNYEAEKVSLNKWRNNMDVIFQIHKKNCRINKEKADMIMLTAVNLPPSSRRTRSHSLWTWVSEGPAPLYSPCENKIKILSFCRNTDIRLNKVSSHKEQR